MPPSDTDPVQETTAQPAVPDHLAPIEPDTAEDDIDSTRGSSISSASTSISSSIINYRYENGRRYHAYREGSYILPNDETEQDRLDLHHHIFRLALGGHLFRAPISTRPKRVLDIGTGTGIWAIDFADEFQDAHVIGTDLSPIQPSWVPPNCNFYVDDVENEWLYPPDEVFDFIHIRSMGGSIADWGRLYTQAIKHLKPGGWIEVQDFEACLFSDDEDISQMATGKWIKILNDASDIFGKKLNVAPLQKTWMTDAGFVHVCDDIFKIPMGQWPKDPKLKELGKYQLEQMCLGIEPFTLALLTRVMKWSLEECQVLMANVRKEFRDPKHHIYARFHYAYGQKPYE